MPDLYVETLSEATSFRYRRADAFIDVDSRYYAARYLRAWQLGALLAEALTEQFNEDWYRNPAGGSVDRGRSSSPKGSASWRMRSRSEWRAGHCRLGR